jgi:ribonuclease HI
VHGFKGAKFKSFKTLKEAQEFIGIFQLSCTSECDENNTKPLVEEKRPFDVSCPDVRQTKRPRVDDIKTASDDDFSSQWSVLLSFDGGSRGNPGAAGAGAEVVVVERTTKGIQKARTKIHARTYLGPTGCTNNMAEWQGVLTGLEQLGEHVHRILDQNSRVKPNVKLVIQGDSQLVIRQLDGSYQCRNPKLIPIKIKVDAAISMLEGMVASLHVKYEHVYRSDNQVADRKFLLRWLLNQFCMC